MDTDRMTIDSPGLEVTKLPESKTNTPRTDDPSLPDSERKATPKPDIMEPVTKEDRTERGPTPRVGTPMLEEQGSTQGSRRASPIDPQSYIALDRPLTVTDALSYLDAVKAHFQDLSDVYNHFLDIMKEFKNVQIDTPGVIRRVSHLFNGHPSLIQGFNTFLPTGYRIECSTDPQEAGFITVTTPTGTTMQSTNGPGGALSWSTAPASRHQPASVYEAPLPPASPDPRMYGMDGQAIEPAVQYVQNIKQRCDPDTYRQFLDILSRYHHTPESIDEEEMSRQVARLFNDTPDLIQGFNAFLPTGYRVECSTDPQEAGFVTVTTPTGTVHQVINPAAFLEAERASPMDPHSYSAVGRPLSVTDALNYVDAVKAQFLDLPDVYNRFLDIMKDFKHDQIDTPGVIRHVCHLFNGHPTLIQGFTTFLPTGYRIECSTDPQQAGFITVTTPTGSVHQVINPAAFDDEGTAA